VTTDASKAAFLTSFAERGVPLDRLAPSDGVREMLDFYAPIRATERVPDYEDMVLFRWGTYDWGAGASFELDSTHQFIAAGLDGGDAFFQLHLTYHCSPAAMNW
jgi:hypothetical protein